MVAFDRGVVEGRLWPFRGPVRYRTSALPREHADTPKRCLLCEGHSAGRTHCGTSVESPYGATRLGVHQRLETSMDQASFPGSEGRIAYRIWSADGSPRRLVVIVHGYAEHGGRYTHVAEELAARGAMVCAPDHIGHGESEGERALIVDFERVVDDLHTLVGIISEQHPGLPTVMVGHSMGGLLTGRYAERYPDRLAGVAFLGAVLGDWPWARDVLENGIPDESSDPAGMSSVEETAREYADDPLVYHGSYKRPLLEAEVAALDRFNAELERMTMPVMFLHGAADPFVPFRTSMAAVKQMPTKDLTVRVYPDARHELVNEFNRDEVIAALATFAERVANGAV